MAGQEVNLFDRLGPLTHTPWLARIDGTVRFDVTDDQEVPHWLLTMRNGFVAVTRECRPADTVVRSDRDTFGRLLAGHLRLLPAWLRNDIAIEGRLLFALVLERILARTNPLDRPLRGVSARER